jgi:hypothetical protein
MKIKNRRAFIICTLTLIIAWMSGCQLAKPELEQDASQDRLIGIYVTFKSIGLSFESYEASSEIDRAVIAELTGKIYAEKIVSGSESGEVIEYEFPGQEGIAMFCPKIKSSHSDASYFKAVFGPEVHLGALSVNSDVLFKLTGEIIISKSCDYIFYPNRVYQTESGDIYMIPATGASADWSFAGSMMLTENEKITTNVNGKQEEMNTMIELTIHSEDEASQYVVKQFREDDSVISTLAFSEDNIPEKISADLSMAYTIVEKIFVTSDDSRQIKREILDWSVPCHLFYFFDDRGISIGHTVVLEPVK